MKLKKNLKIIEKGHRKISKQQQQNIAFRPCLYKQSLEMSDTKSIKKNNNKKKKHELRTSTS